jgi:large conductance mechanosensitive channel
MKQFLSEFKTFITRGNVFQLAVAVVIGGAFSRIVQSLVNDIVMPLLSLLIGRVPFSSLKFVLVEENLINGTAEIAVYYGRFVQNIIDFLIISLVIFVSFKLLKKGLETANKISVEGISHKKRK